MFRILIAAAVAAGGPALARAQPPCTRDLTPDSTVRCALQHSPELQEARHQLAALAGRRLTAGLWLPSNPVLSATAARRTGGGRQEGSVLNWSATLSQELEIGGQRGARLEVADAEAAAQVRRVAVAEADVTARALSSYFEALAAREALELAGRISESSQALAAAVEGRAREALIAGVDADVARAEATRLGLGRYQAARRWSVARAALGILIGAPGEVEVAGELPRPGLTIAAPALEETALRLRGDLAAAQMERRVLERSLTLLRRQRIPNLTLSAFAQRDGFAEDVLGGGLSIPLPLPAPLGRTRGGEIAEVTARIGAADSSLEEVRRRVRLEVSQALAAFRAADASLSLFPDDLLARARADLAALREAMSTKQLSLRDALVAQRSLIELLNSHLEARLDRAQTWVALQRVAGLSFSPLLGGRP
jgi:cobalt-zinc-cadmium efflux system outer membrane protein